MTFEKAFKELCRSTAKLVEDMESLCVTVIEDKPLEGDVLLVDELGNVASDMCGWAKETDAATRTEFESRASNLDFYQAQQALAVCHEALQRLLLRFFNEAVFYERIDELMRFGKARRGEWLGWAKSSRDSLDCCQRQLLEVNELLFRCWQELAECASQKSVSVQSTNIGQQFTLPAR